MAKKELPEWFPFAITAAFLVAIGAGIKSGWKTSANSAPPPPPPGPPGNPTPVQAGVVFP